MQDDDNSCDVCIYWGFHEKQHDLFIIDKETTGLVFWV